MTNFLNLTKERDNNLELLRVIAMFMIVAYHYSVHSPFLITTIIPTYNLFFLCLLKMLGGIGISLFMMITGFYMIKSNSSRSKRLKRTLFISSFYSLTIFFIYSLIKQTIIISNIFALIHPLQWWYLESYIIIVFIYPLINNALTNISKKQFMLLLLFFLILEIYYLLTGEVIGGISSTGFLIFIYCIGSFYSLYLQDFKYKNFFDVLFGIFLFVIIAFYFYSYLSSNNFVYEIGTRVFSLKSPFTTVISSYIFYKFLKLKTSNKPLINNISSTTFGIYLIHDSKIIKPFLWGHLIKGPLFLNSSLFIPYSLLCIIIVFSACSFLDYIRQKIFYMLKIRT